MFSGSLTGKHFFLFGIFCNFIGARKCLTSFLTAMKVSVIIPHYRQAKRLKRSISSLLSQTLTDFEVVLIDKDDDSDAVTLARNMLEGHPNVETISYGSDASLWHIRKLGIFKAHAPYIVFLDPREWLEPRALETLVEIIEQENVDLVQMRRRRKVGKVSVSEQPLPEGLSGRRITGVELLDHTGFVGKNSHITPYCGDKIYRTDLLREAAAMEFNGKWGEVHILNINYLRFVRAIYYIDYFGVELDWTDNYENYKFSRLEDFKYIYTLKRALCRNRDAVKAELSDNFRYHLRQLLEQLVWTPQAIRYFLANEMNDPVWQEVGVTDTIDEAIDKTKEIVKNDQLKSLFKRMVR